MSNAKLGTEISTLQLENPLILASGILDENGYSMKRILEEGAAAVVTKSIGIGERSGYKPPVVVDLGQDMINAIGLANPGIDAFAEEIKIARTANKPVIGSIFASTAEEFLLLAKKMQSYSVDAVELNLSCPHVEKVGSEVGTDPDLVESIVSTVKGGIKIPVFAKLTPNVTSLIEIAKAADKADALVLINTVKAIHIDAYARAPTLSNIFGGLSGPAIKPIGLRSVYDVYSETDKQIIGCGGITNHEDVIEYLMAGASAVEIGTALRSEGRKLFEKVLNNLDSFMEKEGFQSIGEMVGIAVKR